MEGYGNTNYLELFDHKWGWGGSWKNSKKLRLHKLVKYKLVYRFSKLLKAKNVCGFYKMESNLHGPIKQKTCAKVKCLSDQNI